MKYFNDKVLNIKKLKNHPKDILLFLISLRLFPGSPNWLMNITFGHLNIKKRNFILSVMLGLSPWNWLVCSTGSILRELAENK